MEVGMHWQTVHSVIGESEVCDRGVVASECYAAATCFNDHKR